MSAQTIDNSPRIVLAAPDIDKIKQARRFLRGAAELLADASNGNEFLDRVAGEASTLALMAEIAIHEHSE